MQPPQVPLQLPLNSTSGICRPQHQAAVDTCPGRGQRSRRHRRVVLPFILWNLQAFGLLCLVEVFSEHPRTTLKNVCRFQSIILIEKRQSSFIQLKCSGQKLFFTRVNFANLTKNPTKQDPMQDSNPVPYAQETEVELLFVFTQAGSPSFRRLMCVVYSSGRRKNFL